MSRWKCSLIKNWTRVSRECEEARQWKDGDCDTSILKRQKLIIRRRLLPSTASRFQTTESIIISPLPSSSTLNLQTSAAQQAFRPRETHLAGGDRLAGNEELRVNIVEIPLEGLAAKALPQRFTVRHVPVISLQVYKREREGEEGLNRKTIVNDERPSLVQSGGGKKEGDRERESKACNISGRKREDGLYERSVNVQKERALRLFWKNILIRRRRRRVLWSDDESTTRRLFSRSRHFNL